MTDGNGDLPNGWVTTTLCEVRLGLSKSIDPRNSGAEFFKLYSVPSSSDRRPEIVPGNTVGSSKRTVEPNSVLLCKIDLPPKNRSKSDASLGPHGAVSTPLGLTSHRH